MSRPTIVAGSVLPGLPCWSDTVCTSRNRPRSQMGVSTPAVDDAGENTILRGSGAVGSSRRTQGRSVSLDVDNSGSADKRYRRIAGGSVMYVQCRATCGRPAAACKSSQERNASTDPPVALCRLTTHADSISIVCFAYSLQSVLRGGLGRLRVRFVRHCAIFHS